MTIGRTRVTIELPDHLYKAFRIECINRDTTMSKVLRACAKTYANKREKGTIVT